MITESEDIGSISILIGSKTFWLLILCNLYVLVTISLMFGGSSVVFINSKFQIASRLIVLLSIISLLTTWNISSGISLLKTPWKTSALICSLNASSSWRSFFLSIFSKCLVINIVANIVAAKPKKNVDKNFKSVDQKLGLEIFLDVISSEF